MKIITLDFESYWATDYSLSCMSPLEYVMGPQWETISCSIKEGDDKTYVVFGDDVGMALRDLDIKNSALLGHNMSGFDAYVVAYRYGLRPKMWMCTAAMARPIHAKTVGVSLKKLAAFYKRGVKNDAVLMQTKGRHLKDFTPAEIADMRTYNGDDSDLCYGIFQDLRPHYTPEELWQIDAITRMRTEPAFVLDTGLLESALSVERSNKHKALLDLGRMLNYQGDWANEAELVECVRSEMASAPKFSKLLAARGVAVPLKPSPTDPEKQVPALAKTDQAFLDLQESDDPVVAAAARTRLAVKSTLLETRIQKFLGAAALANGRLPVPIRYCGADTTGRDSGEEYNCFVGDTELLTPGGWVRFDQWSGQPVMQWWPDGGASFEETPGRLEKAYEGEVVDVRSKFLSATMTPEHRLVSVRNGGVVERTADWLASHTGLDGVPVAGRWAGKEHSRFTPAEARLLVAIAADGCVVPRKTEPATIQIGLRKQRKVDRLRALLAEAECPYHERYYAPQAGHTGDHDTVQFVLPKCRYQKGFGPWLLELSREALDAVLDELHHWDGWKHPKNGATCFCTSSDDEAAWVATAYQISGRAACMRVSDDGKWQSYERQQSALTSLNTASDVTRVPFSGKVYCASVESSYIFVKRGAKIAVVGQCQNLPRIAKKKPKVSDALRNSLTAPPGYVVMVADQSGIELRVNHTLWKVPSSMEMWKANPTADLYRAFAATNHGVTQEEVSDFQRQAAKVAQLQLQFGSGWLRYQQAAAIPWGLILSDEEAQRTTYGYRDFYVEVVDGWKACHSSLPLIQAGVEREIDPWGLLHTDPEGIRLPSGRLIRYPDLRQEVDKKTGKKEWVYAHGRHKARIYAGKITENCVQALARDSVFDATLDFYKATGLRPALRLHDELVYVVPQANAEELLAHLQSILRTPPRWWPELVVWSEGGVAQTYGAAK